VGFPHRVQASLVTQVNLAVAFLVVVIVAQGVFNTMQTSRIDQAISQSVESSASLVERVHAVHNDFLTFDDQANMWVGLRPYGLTSPLARTTLAQVLTARRSLDRGIAGLLRSPLPAGEHTLLQKLARNVSTYERLWTETEHLAYTDPAASARLMYVGNHLVTARARTDFAQLNALIGQGAEAADGAARSAATQAMESVIAESALLIAIGLIALSTVRRALHPVPALTRTLEAMAAGQFEAQVPQTRRTDEIGRLTRVTAVLGGYLSRARAEQRSRARDLERLSAFNALLADISRIASAAEGEERLLQEVCDVAVHRAALALVWVGVPTASEQVRIAAASGRTGYLEDIPLSVRPDVPEGQGAAGRAWQEGLPQYVPSIAQHPNTGPWKERADLFGITGAVALPLVRGGRRWGILTFYLTDDQEFGPDVRLVLEEAARAVGWGLDRLDADMRERELSSIQHLLIERTTAGIALARGRMLVVVNRRLVEMLGYDNPDDLVGRSTRALYASDDEFRRVGEAYLGIEEQAAVDLPNVHLRRRDGMEVIGDVTMSLTRQGGQDIVVWTVHDVTERFRLEQMLQEQAYHDALTDLPNKRSLDLELQRALERARRHGTALVVGMLDLDDFKAVNSALGHEAGDRVLREFALRLRRQMRQSEFAARSGGDEFVLLLEDFELPLAEEELQAALSRLHAGIAAPMEISPGQDFPLDVSLGLAVYPADGVDGQDLLGKADQALSSLKAHKHDRQQWWQMSSRQDEAEPAVEEQVDAYDEGARELLATAHDVFLQAAQDFAQALTRLATEARDLFAALDREGIHRHADQQARHMIFLFDPATTRDAIRARARELGEQHSLVGLDAALLSRSFALYRDLLTERLNRTLMSARQRYRLLLFTERRLMDHLEAELAAMQQVTGTYFDLLALPLPDGGTRWVDAFRAELDVLGALPGVQAVLLLRLTSEGFFTVEHGAGREAERAEALLASPEAQRQLAADVGEAPGATVGAWREGQILTIGHYDSDVRVAPWWQAVRQIGGHSMLAIPVLDTLGHLAAGICVFGAYPGQFESQTMHQFAQSVELRWEELWRRSALPAGSAAMPHAVARAYRERLFAGGLSMYVQPVVDLRDGALIKVEALARLVQPDGTVVPPATFLPLLGDGELARLFRQGLDQAIAWLPRWQAQGLTIGLSVNLPPSTLLVPECESWVAEALATYDVAPELLTLELLETTLIDEQARDEAIARLSALGIHLALDDLGSGYSSLRRLSTLPFHTVKIDQGLLRRLRDEPQVTLAVLDTMIEMGRRLQREVVVEGLEDPGTIEAAALLGAPWGQGYGLGRPMPPGDLLTWHQGFRLPIEPGRAHTFVGAMAHFWKYHSITPFDVCPVTGFLREQGLEGSDAWRWHEDVHRTGEPGAAEALAAWFLEQMRRETARAK